MEHDPKHEGPKPHHHSHGMWASWHSPVGLGFFFLTTALAAAIALYALLNLIGTLLSVMRPAPTYSYPSDTSGLEAPATTDMGAGATGAAMPE